MIREDLKEEREQKKIGVQKECEVVKEKTQEKLEQRLRSRGKEVEESFESSYIILLENNEDPRLNHNPLLDESKKKLD